MTSDVIPNDCWTEHDGQSRILDPVKVAARFTTIFNEAIEAAAKVISQSPLIDAPKLPAECWRGLARAALTAALPHLQGWRPSERETVNAKLADALRSLLHLAQASNSTEQDWNDAVDTGFAALASDEAIGDSPVAPPPSTGGEG